MKVKAIYTPSIPVDSKNRMELVDASRGLSTMTLVTVVSQAAIMNAINIHTKMFGESVEINNEFTTDLNKIATELVFNVNEVLHLDMDLVMSTVSSLINRLYPTASIEDCSNYNQLNLIFSNTVVIPDIVITEISKNSYYTEKVYACVLSLFNYSEGYNLEYDDGVIAVKKI